MREFRLFILLIIFTGHSGFSISDEKTGDWAKDLNDAQARFDAEMAVLQAAKARNEIQWAEIASRRGASTLGSGQVEFKEAYISNERIVKLSDGSIWEIKHNSGYGNESAFFISTGPKSANVWIDGSVYGATLLKGNPAYLP